VGLDWYRISVSNVIGTPNPTSEVATDIAQTGAAPAYITEQFENLGEMRTDGFEATFRQALPTQLGTFTLAADWAWVWHFDLANGPGQPTVDLAGNNLGIDTVFGASFPRWKGNTSLNWVSPNRNWNATLTWQYTGPYSQAIQGAGEVGSYSQFTCSRPTRASSTGRSMPASTTSSTTSRRMTRCGRMLTATSTTRCSIPIWVSTRRSGQRTSSDGFRARWVRQSCTRLIRPSVNSR
jgi:hypothetical protein